MGFFNKDERDLGELEEESEILKQKAKIQEQEMKIEEMKALEAEAKRRYGKDWKKMLSGANNFTGGIDWQAIKFKL